MISSTLKAIAQEEKKLKIEAFSPVYVPGSFNPLDTAALGTHTNALGTHTNALVTHTTH